MIKDNIKFTTKETAFDSIELVGRYDIEASLIIRDIEWRKGGSQIKKDAEMIITDHCRKIITADVLDVPFLKLLYKNDALKQLVIDALDIRVFDLRNRIMPKSNRNEYEAINALEKVIYALRILPNEVQ